ncbi:archaea-specific SMC-related protein [Halorarius litoreus]|uniref:archaea-specific SMC-related protein n=1 Tax=Halorarius litoreus TaxID=2962676 RepID=UPI0020CEFDD3|nr:archaea-specific SMC-related protein [Halorarius litoreus]
MSVPESAHAEAEVTVENVGGIEASTVTFSPGVTILVGRNATNRTSFLQAVMAALGSKNVSIKGDADEAEVELTLGDETYTRRLQRRQGSVVTDGTPYLEDAELADLFAFLLESNEARRAVATSGDLRELIMRPIDTDEIHAEIDRLVSERERLERELDEIDELKGELPELESKRTRLEEDIEEKKAELEAKEEELEAADADVEEQQAEKSELESELERLRSKRSALDDVRYDLETERESLDALKGERRELEAEAEELPETPMGELEEVESELRQLREQKQRLETEVSELQSVIGFNEELLEDTGSGVFAGLSDGEGGALTDQLLDDDEVTCWTCGSEVERDQIESTVGRLRELSQETVSEVNALDTEINDLTSEKRDLEQSQRERDRIERRLADIDDEIEDSEARIESLQERREALTEEIEAVEADVEALEDEDHSAVLDLHKEANQLEYELGRLETDLERVESEITDLEARIETEADVEAQRDEVTTEIETLRTKIERIEQGAVEEFNEHMDTVLELLDYANLDRIWLERVEREVREGRRKVTKGVFELHVVRTTESGAAYEDTVDHLSESEREVTGLVFALAGYLAHEVYETLPFMLLDSLEAIDSERIATLVEYLTDYTDYLLVALLPEDAAALPDEYERVTEI